MKTNKTLLKNIFLLTALIASFSLIMVGRATAQPFTFGPQVQSTNSASITNDSGTGAFQYTDAANSTEDHAYLPLTGNAATFITTTNGWTASINVNISARSMTVASGKSSHVVMGLVFLGGSLSNDAVFIFSAQDNNTGGGDNQIYPDGWYGTAVRFGAQTNGVENVTTALGNSVTSSNGSVYLPLSGGTNASAGTESFSNVAGVLTLNYNAAIYTVAGYYNGIPVGSYSLASWGSNPALTLAVWGGSGSGVVVPAGTDTASNFYAGPLAAQTFTTLHTFTKSTTDGYNPLAGLIISGNTLYGATDGGGYNNDGVVFAISTNGSGYTNLYSGDAGSTPDGTLLLSGSTLYETAYYGGTYGNGSVFAISTNGTGFTNLYSFTGGSDGQYPNDTLLLSGNTLYGTTREGGSSGYGVVFKVKIDGSSFTNLHSFTNGSDGAQPHGLVISDNILYGPTIAGTVFRINTDGTGFTNLHNFTNANYSVTNFGPNSIVPNYTNNDGVAATGLILSGSTLYGTAFFGGTNGNGTIFALNTNGTGFTILHTFPASRTNSSGLYTNSDGAHPYERGLLLSGNTLYGTAALGGTNGNGTVFELNTNGSAFMILHTFAAGTGFFPHNYTNSDGAMPFDAALILSGNTLYGTAKSGGTNGFGTVFALSLPPPPPQLALIHSGANVILMWPTNATGFTLQFTTNLAPPVVWTSVSPAPVVVNTNNAVTNAISGTEQFYRLSQ